jgi:ankyrin repeat protein
VLGNYAYHEAALNGNCMFYISLPSLSPQKYSPSLSKPQGRHKAEKRNANTPLLTDEIIDILLDQEGFECDPINRLERDTPLHSAIRYINSQTTSFPPNPRVSEFAHDLISMMIEAGSDPRIRNKANLTPYQLVDPRNAELREQLQDALDVMQSQGDYIVDDEEDGVDGEGDVGSASDSDFDPEEYKREKERRKGGGA